MIFIIFIGTRTKPYIDQINEPQLDCRRNWGSVN